MKDELKKIIELLGLETLENEGGLFNQTYLSNETISQEVLPKRYKQDKPFGTAIYYLLTSEKDSFSAMHKLLTDEIYHFYLGDPVELVELKSDGSSRKVVLGQDILNGENVQYLVEKDVWQGSRLVEGGKWALLGTTMSPGFTEEDFVLGNRKELCSHYPEMAESIIDLTHDDENA